jgi:hypothetical protein
MGFTVDGRRFNYRDPKHGSKHSYEYTNPLYDYKKKEVKKAAEELDIGNVNSKKEVRQIVRFLENRNKEEEEPTPAPEPATTPDPEPLPPRGSTFTEDTQTFDDTRLQNPENQAPRQTFTEGPDRPNRDAIRYGEDINSHYINKFIPSLEADARLTAQEIGESGRFNLDRFIGKVPELGDPKDLFTYYSDKLKENK